MNNYIEELNNVFSETLFNQFDVNFAENYHTENFEANALNKTNELNENYTNSIQSSHNIVPAFDKIETNIISVDKSINTTIKKTRKFIPPTKKSIEKTQPIQNSHVKQMETTKDTSSTIGSVIFGSLNLLNDEDATVSSQLSQSTSPSVKSLNRNESFSSTSSLPKTFIDLDNKNSENINTARNINDDFINMFKDYKNTTDPKTVVMSTEYGDMGFNVWYKDHSNYICDDSNGKFFFLNIFIIVACHLTLYPLDVKRINRMGLTTN